MNKWYRTRRRGAGAQARRRSSRTALVATAAMAVLTAVPVANAADVGRAGFPLPDFGSWFSSSPGAWHGLPQQEGGTAAGKSHRVAADATRAGGGNGHAPGTGPGQLPPFALHPRTTKTTASGPGVGDGSHSFDPRTSKRLADQSTATSDLYKNSDGTYTRKVYAGRSNYRDASGTWTPIDTALAPGGDGRVHEKANSQAVDFAASADDPALASVAFDGSHSVAYGLRDAAKVAPKVSGSTVTYPGVLPNTDLALSTVADGFKESMVLHSASAPTSWVFPLRTSGLTPRLAADGSVEFVDGAGAVVGRMPHGFMEDASVDPRNGGHARSAAVTYQLTTVGGAPALRMSIDPAWLADPKRVFPVTVDPGPTGTTEVLSDLTGDFSSYYDMDAGTWNGGGEVGVALMAFSGLGSSLSGNRITSASLSVFDYWASSCTAFPFSVNPITQSWSVTGSKSWPGPSTGGSIGSVTADPGSACTNTAGTATVGTWMTVGLSTDTFNSWTTGGADNGLAITASSTDSRSWKRFDTVNSPNQPSLTLNYTPDVPPQVDSQYPPNNYNAPTLTPELLATGHDPDNWPGPLQYDFTVYNSSGTPVADSTKISTGDWIVPAGKLSWSQTYYWTVQTWDGWTWSTGTATNYFTTTVPQPLITSTLAQNSDAHGFDPSIGDYTTEATDASVRTVGPALSVVRDYNSLDPRTAGAFGSGWSSTYDMKATEVRDPSNNLTSLIITYPNGQQVGFGNNGDGTFAPPSGRFATLTSITGGYKLVDKSDTAYTFTQAVGGGVYALTSIADYASRSLTLTYNNSNQIATATSGASGRALHFTWNQPGGAQSWHVTSVATDPATQGVSSTAEVWNYSYTGDQLTGVCPPTSTTACTTYSYTADTHYPTTVLDAGPYSYWRLGESAGATTAASEVLVNEGADAANYGPVTLGQPGPLPGSPATSATFDGSSSYVALKNGLVQNSTYLAVSMWFSTTASGILFSTDHDTANASNPGTGAMPVLYVGTDGKLYGHYWNNSVTGLVSSGPVNDGNWHHVVLSGAGNTQTLYVDGQSVTGSPLSGQLVNVDPYNIVGAGVLNGNTWAATPSRSGNIWWHFNGKISDVAFYNHPLTASVVAQQYTNGHSAASVLATVTAPSGDKVARVAYDAIHDRVTQVTDNNGGVWKLHQPIVTGSSQVYRAAVFGSAPADYWRLGDTGGTQPVNQVHGGTAGYSNVTFGVTGPFASTDATATGFNGSTSNVQLPSGMFPSASSQELWFNTTSTGGVLLSSQSAALGGGGSAAPTLWISPDGKLRGLNPNQSPTGPFVSGLPGKCIDDSGGSDANGTHVQLWDCLPTSNSSYQNQSWTLFADGTIRNFGKCLDIYNGNTANGTLVELWDCNGGTGQQWQVTSTGALKNPASGRCLDDPSSSTTNGTQLQIWDCNNQPNQTWTQNVGATRTGPFAGGITGKCVDDSAGGIANGTHVQLWDCVGNTNQSWTLNPDGTIRDFGKCLDISGGGTAAGTKVQLWDCNAGGGQIWQATSTGALKNPASGRCLDDPSSSTANGTQLQIWDCNGSNAQVWIQSMVSAKTVDDGQWHHAVLTGSGVNQTLYVDGTQAGTTTGTVNLQAGTARYAYLGAGDTGTAAAYLAPGTTAHFNGSMEEAAFYRSVLSSSDIARHYAAYKSALGSPAPLETVQVDDPGATSVAVGAFPGTTYNASASQTWTGTSAKLVFQGDGNLVIYRTDTGAPTWASNTSGHPGAILAFQGDGNLVIYSDSTGATALWGSGTQGHSGNTATFQPNGTLTISDGTGRQLFSAGTMLTNAPHVTTYAYDPAYGDRALSTTDATGGKTSYGYDSSGFQYTVTDPNGNVTTTGHDARGNVVAQTTCQNQPANTCSTIYHTYYLNSSNTTDARNDLVLTSRDGRSANATDNTYLTSYTYDTGGNQTTATTPPVPGFPNGRTTTTVYTDGSATYPAADSGNAPTGLLASATTPGGAKVAMTYFHNGDPAKMVDPAGEVTTFTYDALGRVATKTVTTDSYPNGLTTSYTYDGLNRTVTKTDPARTNRVTGAVHTPHTTTVFDADGNVTTATVTDTTGGDAARTTTSSYDASDRLATTTDAAGQSTTYGYDAYGNMAKEVDPAGTETDYAYDALGHLLTTTLVGYTGDPANPSPAKNLVENSRAYDPAGRLTSVTDSMGWVTAYTYTDNGLTATVTRQDPAHSQSFVQQANTYDAAGNLIQRVTNNGTTTTTYTVDAAGRTTSSTLDPSGVHRTTATSYSPDNYVLNTVQTDPTGAIAATDYTYDPLGRKTSRTVHNDTTGHPVGQWNLDDGAGVVAADTSGNGNTAYLTSSAGWANGALNNSGTAGAAATAGPVLDTTKDFSISAWVNMANASAWHTAVSQDATQNSGFYLQYDATDNRWAMSMTTSDTAGATGARALSASAPSLNTWTHLVGTYTAATGTLQIYVNGVPGGAATDTTPIASKGSLEIGRGKFAGNPVDFFAGQIADVQVYNRAISPTEAATLYGQGGNGAAWASGPARYTTAGGPIVASGPAVNTAASYSVSAWANLNSAISCCSYTVVSQTGTNASAMLLQYSSGSGTWSFTSAVSDSATPSWIMAKPSLAPTVHAWTHLVGTFDATTGAMKLYINGALAGTATNTAPWNAGGPLTVGAIKQLGGNSFDTFDGQIANVQVFARSLTLAEVGSLYSASRTGGALNSQSLTTSWRLDQRGLPTATTDPNGNTTTYSYDEAGRQAVATQPAVNVETGGGTPVLAHPVSSVGYDTFGEQVESSDPNGDVTTAAYDAGGRVTSSTLPNYTPPGSSTAITATSTRTYNKVGQVASQTDALNNTTTFTYDQLGDLATATRPGGAVTHYTYDTNGDQLSATDPTGAQTQATYDYLGHVLTSTQLVRQPSQAAYTTTNSYADTAGFLASTQGPTGVQTGYTYNATGQPTKIVDGAGNATAYGYDFLGRAVTTTAPDATSTAVTYDEAGRAVAQTQRDPAGVMLRSTSAAYDANGNAVSTTDALGHTATFAYDATNTVIGEVQPVSAAASISTSFGYDSAGNRTRFTDGRGSAFITTYNTWNLPESTVEPATAAYPNAADRTFTVAYDADGRLATQTSPGGVVVTDAYDALGDLTGQTGTGAAVATVAHSFGYDNAGRMTSASAPSGTDAFTYDDRGLLLSTGGPSGTSTFAYNGAGQMTSRTDTAGTSTYGYDTAGRLSTVGDASTGATLTYGYNNLSLPTSVGYGSGADTRTFGYDTLHRLTSDTLKNSSGGTIASIAYGYDLNNNETGKTTTGFAGATANTYTYDWANRIASWNDGTTTVGYAYDASGNRTQVGAATFTYDARNELTSDGKNSYTYTARGTLATTTPSGQAAIASTSDAFNRVITQGGQTYTYDSLDRIATAGGRTFAYSGMGNDAASDGTATYSRGPAGGLIGVKQGTSSALALTDLHTDIVADFAPSAGTLTASAAYDPFGNVTAGTGMLGNLGYQSAWTDTSTGKVDMAARWYSPATGQFSSRDSLGLNPVPSSVSADRFAYVNDNPLTGGDPTGHCDWWNLACGAQQAVSNVQQTWNNTIQPALSTAWNATVQFGEGAWNGIASTAVAMWNGAINLGLTIWNGAQTLANNVGQCLSDVGSCAQHVITTVQNTVNDVYNTTRNAVTTVWHATQYAVTHPVQAITYAYHAATTYVKAHAADIVSFVASTAVGIGCEAVLGVATFGVGAVAGAVACGALAGAVASAVTYGMTTPMNKWNAADFGKSVAGGAFGGAVGGLFGSIGGELVSSLGSKLLGPTMESVAERLGPAAVDDTITATDDAVTTAADDAATSAASDASHAGESSGGAGEPSGSGSEPSGKGSEPSSSETHPSGEHEPSSEPNSEGESCPHSFAPDTEVLMADGTTKKIADVKLGDKVASTDPATAKTTSEPVVALHDNHDTDLADVTVKAKGGAVTVLHTTWHHPFWSDSAKQWTDAADLRPGMELHVWDRDKQSATVVSVKTWTGLHDMHDLTIAQVHTYYVVMAGTPVLVHNCIDTSNLPENNPTPDDVMKQAHEMSDTADGKYLYRGIRSDGYNYDEALNGSAVPLGGHSDPMLHQMGNTQSELTSFTPDLETAQSFALDGGRYEGHLILRIPYADVDPSRMVVSGNRGLMEWEIQIYGRLDGCEVSCSGGDFFKPGS